MSISQVGLRIRNTRESKRMSIEELSKRTGLPAAFLRQLESEDLYPSIGPLLRIARALGMRPATLMDDQVVPDPLVMRASDRQQELSAAAAKGAPALLRFHSLGRGKADRHMEPFLIEVSAESEKDRTPSTHDGEEFLVVVSGEVQVIYGDQTHRLKPGDSIFYDSSVPHNVSAVGGDASIYAVLYVP
jgi:transcriptional regulator with XRE-family HTH domain